MDNIIMQILRTIIESDRILQSTYVIAERRDCYTALSMIVLLILQIYVAEINNLSLTEKNISEIVHRLRTEN